MSAGTPRALRADAARNFDKIVRSAREVFAEHGPDASLDEVARHAGVGIATLFRRFPDKGVLLRAVLDQQFSEQVLPAMERADRDNDVRRGLTQVWEAALSSAADAYNVLTAARSAGVLTPGVGDRFFDALTPLIERGQREGVVRDDLVPEDLRRLMTMLVSVLWTMDPGEDGWRRYVALVLDGLSPVAAHPLPCGAPALRRPEA
ncbi:TetR/AcrR family transcriptional regulator [Streptomyces sp. NPDC091412]|uniref:TetR/AcrR family transcriptional regulator n=1 Tax=Streptomyces sp. NPDC091412 TaxID=3366002 RepID=UPI00382B16EA